MIKRQNILFIIAIVILLAFLINTVCYLYNSVIFSFKLTILLMEKCESEVMRNFNYSKIKDEKWDSDILCLIVAIYKEAGKQEMYLKQRPEELEKLVEIAKIQSTEASNAIEGIITTSARIKKLVEEKTTSKNRDEQEIAGYRDGRISDVTGQSIQEELSADDIFDLNDSDDSVVGNIEVEPLIMISVFIHDFLCIHPFNDGNDRMSRLLTTLLLYRNKFYVGKYISLEAKTANNKDLYYEALAQAQNG